MDLHELVSEVEKQASEEGTEEDYTEEEIKEAYAAGRLAGAAFADEIQKMAQDAKTDEMGVAYNENENANKEDDTSTQENTNGKANVDAGREDINKDKKTVRDANNDQQPGDSTNDRETDGPQPNKPKDNRDKSVEAAAQRVIEALQ